MQNTDHTLKKILVVEADHNLKRLLFEVLAEAGYIIDLAEDGKKALHKIINSRYNLVISGINIPKIDGINLYRKAVKEFQSLRQGQFLFITDNIADQTSSLIAETNCNYISKPFRTLDLLVRINAILNKEEVMLEKQRSEERFRWSADCQLIEDGTYDNIPFIASIENVSKNGARARYTGKPFTPGSKVNIHIMYLDFQSTAEVVWSKTVNEPENWVGLRFTKPIELPLQP